MARSTVHFALLSLVNLIPGCVFFENTFDPCIDDPVSCGTAGNSSVGAGGKSLEGSGAALGSGGDLSSGGSRSGGTGAVTNAGGTESGGSGSGGISSGGSGSGGASTGGAGGSGGISGSGGGGGAQASLVLSELKHGVLGFFEVHNISDAPISLDGVGVAVGPNDLGYDVATYCDLSGKTIPANGYLVAQEDSAASCLGGGDCVGDCSFGLGSDEYGWLIKDGTRIHVVKYPNSSTLDYPGQVESWQSSPSNSQVTNFCRGSWSPGVENPKTCP